MARFASDCNNAMEELTKRLEVELGPDTAELAMRIGMHSGPVSYNGPRAFDEPPCPELACANSFPCLLVEYVDSYQVTAGVLVRFVWSGQKLQFVCNLVCMWLTYIFCSCVSTAR